MRQWLVDAFASKPFMGNPACVVEPVMNWLEDRDMQAMARENRQPMTAFLKATGRPDMFDLRWFNPDVEVSACGHATLAAGHVLIRELGLAADAVSFRTRAGELAVRRTNEEYEIQFPPDLPIKIAEPTGLSTALGVRPLEVWRGRFVIALLKSAEEVVKVAPNFSLLFGIDGGLFGPGHVAVAALADGGRFDVVDRCFIPRPESPEDLATGTAHCSLAPLFSERLAKSPVRFLQAAPGRGAAITAHVRKGDVALQGGAVTIFQGDWCLDR